MREQRFGNDLKTIISNRWKLSVIKCLFFIKYSTAETWQKQASEEREKRPDDMVSMLNHEVTTTSGSLRFPGLQILMFSLSCAVSHRCPSVSEPWGTSLWQKWDWWHFISLHLQRLMKDILMLHSNRVDNILKTTQTQSKASSFWSLNLKTNAHPCVHKYKCWIQKSTPKNSSRIMAAVY